MSTPLGSPLHIIEIMRGFSKAIVDFCTCDQDYVVRDFTRGIVVTSGCYQDYCDYKSRFSVVHFLP
jgi:hypothetical protein